MAPKRLTSAKERIADLKAADEVSTPDAKDARIEHGQECGLAGSCGVGAKAKEGSREGFNSPSLQQGLRLHVVGAVPATARLDRPPVETRQTRSHPQERSADSGQAESIRRTLAARRGTLRQTPSRQSRDAGLKVQRNRKAQRTANGSSVARCDHAGHPQRNR